MNRFGKIFQIIWIFVTETWDEITQDKEERLKSFFGITQEELAVVGQCQDY